MNCKGVFRTAPATPGLLKSCYVEAMKCSENETIAVCTGAFPCQCNSNRQFIYQSVSSSPVQPRDTLLNLIIIVCFITK